MPTSKHSAGLITGPRDRHPKHFERMDCAVCLEAYSSASGANVEDRRPRLMACGHCACIKCLHKLFHHQQNPAASASDPSDPAWKLPVGIPVDANRNPNSVLCPFDRCETVIPSGGVEGLKINWALMNIIEDAEKQERSALPSSSAVSGPLCPECQSKPAEIHCPACDTDLCRECSNSIHAPRVLQPHKANFVFIADKPKKAKLIPNCPIHGDPLRYWCITDRAQICPSCVLQGEHKGHNANTIGAVAAVERKELEEKLIRAQEVEKKLLKKVIAANQAVDNVDDTQRALKEKIEQDAAELILLINNHKRDLLALVEERSKERMGALTTQSTQLAQALNGLRASISHVQAATRTANGTGTASASPSPSVAPSPAPPAAAVPLSASEELEADLALIREKASLVSRVESAEAACGGLNDVTADSKMAMEWSGVSVSNAGDALGAWAESRRSAVESALSPVKVPSPLPAPVAAPVVNVPSVITPPPSSPFSSPYYIATSPDLIFVTDYGTHSVFIFRMDGSFVRSFGSKGSADGQLSSPYVVTFVDGSLYVADGSNNRICVFGPDGTFRRKWALPFSPYGITFGGGLFFITDYNAHRIHAYRPDGTHVRSFGSSAEAEGKLHYPFGICYHADHLYVVNYSGHSVSVFRSDGQFVRRFGSLGSRPGQLNSPYDITVHNGKVLIPDCANHRISVFSLEGAFIKNVGSEGSGLDQFKNPKGLAVTGQSALIVDYGNKRIRSLPLGSLQ